MTRYIPKKPYILAKKSWAITENKVTAQHHYLNRRQLIAGLGISSAALLLSACNEKAGAEQGSSTSDQNVTTDPNQHLYPAPANPKFTVNRPLTEKEMAETYNNFYEFGSHKTISRLAQSLPVRPWSITIDGLVDHPQIIDFDDLIKTSQLEERIYRFRCVEAWSMTIPWTGFPLKDLLKRASPKVEAKYVRFETFYNPDVAIGQKQSWYPWPYIEGLRLDEAMHDLSFLVTGAYGEPLKKQFGAPIRLALPWKYGFKSIKSIVKITLTDKMPTSFWMDVASSEYGFYANVNPDVAHKRWSQANEKILGSSKTRPTRLYNGYTSEVAHLYKDNDDSILWY